MNRTLPRNQVFLPRIPHASGDEPPELREKYRFSTIAFKKMLSAKIKKYHADRIRDAYIAFSLNDLNAEGNEYLGQLPDPHDALREFESEQSAEAFLKDIMPALTERQRKHLAGMAGERKPREIMQEMRLSFTEFWKDRAAIREAAAAVIGRESCGGVFDTWTGGLLLSI